MVDLQQLQFRFEHDSQMGYPDPEHALSAYEGSTDNPDNYRGMISWHQKTGEIGYIHTGPLVRQSASQEDYRRQGIGTALLHQAQFEAGSRGLAQPQHSADLTDAGAAFARSVPM